MTGVRPRGECPVCHRVISGRKIGNSRVALTPHKMSKTSRTSEDCLMRGGRRVVDRLPDATPTT